MRTETELFDTCKQCPEYYSDISEICKKCDVFHELFEMGKREFKAIQESRIKRGIPLNGLILESEGTSHTWDKQEAIRLIELGISLKTISLRIENTSYSTLAIFRRDYLKSKGYSKQEQLKMNRTKRAKKRNSIQSGDYQKMIENFGSDCYFCKKQGVEAHHVKFRSQGGRGTWRNLRMLCIPCHDDLHTLEEMRIELQAEHERLFGRYYYMDHVDLFETGLIDEPDEKHKEQFFLKVTP
jgi:hypothetical protein